MIAYVNGKLAYKNPSFVIIEAAGLGYQIKISLNTYSALPGTENCKLHTYLHIKEDGHTLFGFATESEKKMFMDLISISGVGPGTAIVVLSYLAVNELQDAIISEDARTIQSIKGIGAKTAQRIILELKDKIKKEGLTTDAGNITSISRNTLRTEALTALVTLGIARPAAEKNIDNVLKSSGNSLTLEEVIKQALRIS
jgi:holliday junction DNA helicase RuvA